MHEIPTTYCRLADTEFMTNTLDSDFVLVASKHKVHVPRHVNYMNSSQYAFD